MIAKKKLAFDTRIMQITSKAPKAAKKAEKAAPAPKAPKAPKATEKAPKAAEKAAAPKAAAAAKKAPEKAAAAAPKATEKALDIHINKTGRFCFSATAKERMADYLYPKGHCIVEVKGNTVRLDMVSKAAENTTPVRDASGRPYISATKAIKPLGFDGSQSYDFVAKAYGKAGFEFVFAA